MIGDLALPVVPVIGIDPVVQWLLAVAAAMLPALFSVLLIFLKQKFNADRVDANGVKIAAAAQRGAVFGRLHAGDDPNAAILAGLDYVKASVPDAIKATPQATDRHLADMIKVNLPAPVTPIAVPPADIKGRIR